MTTWYLDCFCYSADREFPVNTYYSSNLSKLAKEAASILSKEISGIDEIRISTETKGLCPMSLDA